MPDCGGKWNKPKKKKPKEKENKKKLNISKNSQFNALHYQVKSHKSITRRPIYWHSRKPYLK